MSPEQARMALLRAEIERDWQRVGVFSERATSVAPSTGLAEASLVALSLDHAYQAFESMLVRIERALGLPERPGADWHRALLADAVLALPGLRPAVIPTGAERPWDELRRFRHFLRHAYTVELDSHRLAQNVRHLQEAVTATQPSIIALLDALGAEGPDG